jgi:cohesin complex subunit SCC1
MIIASALSTLPPSSPPPDSNQITPRTAAKIATLPPLRDKSSPAAPKAKKAKLVQADSELELDESEFAMNRDNSDILTAERYVPADPEVVRLREIMDDPAGHFLPSLKMDGDIMFYAGPQDLAPELAGLFTFPSNILRKRPEEGAQDERLAKRPRVEEEDDNALEALRRDSTVHSARDGFFPEMDSGLVPDQPMDDWNIPGPDAVDLVTPTRPRVRSPSLAPSNAESFVREVQNQRSTGDHLLAMFEKDISADTQSQSQQLNTPSKSIISEPISKTSSGYSKNTGMAMGLLRREIEAIEEEDKVVGLAKIADKVCHLLLMIRLVLMNRHPRGQHQPSSSSCSSWAQRTQSSSTRRSHSVMSISEPKINCLKRSLFRVQL